MGRRLVTNPVMNLKKIVRPESFEEAQGAADLVLEERDGSNPYKIQLKGVPAGSLLLKTDDFEPQHHFLIKGKGLRKRADFALIDHDRIIFIELKSGRVDKKEIERQFNGAKCVIDYCASIGKHFFNDPNFLAPAVNTQDCVLLFKNRISIKKRNTRSSQKHKKMSCGVFDRLDCDGEAHYKELVNK